MTVIETLKHDHMEVKKLFGSYFGDLSEATLEKIILELGAHTQAEEDIVYPAFAQFDAELVKHSKKEHDEADELIAAIRGEQDADTKYDLMAKLQDAIFHHVQEEETKLFPEAEQKLPVSELEELGERFATRKTELL